MTESRWPLCEGEVLDGAGDPVGSAVCRRVDPAMRPDTVAVTVAYWATAAMPYAEWRAAWSVIRSVRWRVGKGPWQERVYPDGVVGPVREAPRW